MRRVMTTLALVAVFMLAMTATAFAAPPAGTTPISPPITGGINAQAEGPNTGWVTLGWTLPTDPVTVNQEVSIPTTATRNYVDSILRVMYVIEVKKNGVNADAGDFVATISGQDSAGNVTMTNIPIPLDTTGNFWYIGDRAIGFTLSATNVANTIKVTFLKSGNYSITAYAVQLAEQP